MIQNIFFFLLKKFQNCFKLLIPESLDKDFVIKQTNYKIQTKHIAISQTYAIAISHTKDIVVDIKVFIAYSKNNPVLHIFFWSCFQCFNNKSLKLNGNKSF